MQNNLQAIAEELFTAEKECKAITPLSERYPSLTLKEAYAIQTINAEKRLKNGERLLGYKIGLTSKAAQKHFGVNEPDFGHLFHTMQIENDAEIELSTLLQAKIEGEIAFVMGKDLPKDKVTLAQVMEATDYVTCSFEIIDSRIKDWKIKCVDTIADNGSSARFILSSQKTLLKDVDLPFVGMALSRNNEVEITGSGAAVLGNPLNAVVFLAQELAAHGKQIKAGDIILSGSLSGMFEMKAEDHFKCEMWKLGTVSTRVKRSAV